MAGKEDLADQLLRLARGDLASAEALYETEGISSANSGFHAQQAVEKALKAVLATREIDFPFTHNITLLMQLCEDAGFEIPEGLSDADRLIPYAAAVRYGLGDPEAVASSDALKWAALAIEWAESQLRPGNDPQ
jgi:HEPN domain-containing protein